MKHRPSADCAETPRRRAIAGSGALAVRARGTAQAIAGCWQRLPARWRALVQAAAFACLAWGLWEWFYARSRLVAVLDPDAEDYAQIALQLLWGRGMGSRVLPLCGLEYLSQTGANPAGGLTWPNLHRFPLMPLLEWGLFHLYGGPCERALSAASGIFYIGAAPLLFLLGRQVAGSRVAAVTTALYLVSPLSLRPAVSGLTEPAAAFFLLAVVLLLTGSRGRPAIALAGLLWGIAFWNRYNTATLALPLVVYLAAQDWRRAPGNAAAFLVPMLAAMAPEMLRNVRLTGDPLFSLTAALMVPYKSDIARAHWWYVPVYVKPAHVLLAWPAEMWEKWTHEFCEGWRRLPAIPGHPATYPFVAASLFLKAEAAALRRLRLLVLAFLAINLLTLPLLSNIVRYYSIFSPLLLLLGVWAAARLLCWSAPDLWGTTGSGRAPWARWCRTVGTAAALAALAYPATIGWIDQDDTRPTPNPGRALVDYRRAHMQAIQGTVRMHGVVVTNAPWSVAWRADRKAVPLPPDPALVPLLAREYGLDLAAIFLTPRKIGAWEALRPARWEAVRVGDRTIPGFTRFRTFPDGAVLLVREDSGSPPQNR